LRVAAAQLAVTTDVAANLDACRRLIGQAAQAQASLVVLPEFCNHPAWYQDQAAAQAVAVTSGDHWLSGIAQAAAAGHIWVMVNATRRADDGRVFGSNFLFDDAGVLVTVTDKQVLMGGESLFLSVADQAAAPVDTPLGRLGLYSCMDGVINETPRGLALRGAQVLCNSLNSFALDEASLHIPVRAAENRVFVVAANKVGPLLGPETTVEVAAKLQLDPGALVGAGESQIVAPDGTVLAMGPRTGEAIVVADIDVSDADDKRRPDGTDRFAVRRPTLYADLAKAPLGRTRPAGAPVLTAAVIQPDDSGEGTSGLLEQIGRAAGHAAIIVLPELATEPGGIVTDVHEAVARGAEFRERVAKALTGTTAVVVTSVAEFAGEGLAHVGLVISANGVESRSIQMHRWARHSWVDAVGSGVSVVDLPWGRLATIVGDDITLPESARLAALAEADVLAVPFAAQEPWEVTTGLLERAAENRLCLVAATRPGPNGSSRICSLERDFTLWTAWSERSFDGRISHPLVTEAPNVAGTTAARIHPAAAANRVLTRETDVVDSRPWQLLDAIVTVS
jgi:predicted amidohydrolase